MTQDAIVRNIEIIGEAAARIMRAAPDFVTDHPEIPWAKMRGIRNVAIHEYFSVDYRGIWDAVRDDLPALRARVETLLAAGHPGP